MKLTQVLFYSFCLSHCTANVSKIKDQLSEETSSTVDEEDGRINLTVGRGSSAIEKHRMARSLSIESTNAFITDPKFFERMYDNDNTTEDNLDIIFEDKKREDAYKRTAAENSPHSVMLMIMFNKKVNPLTCSGTLLTQSLVLTCAHCLFKGKIKATSVIVYAGGNAFVEISNGQPAEGSQQQVSTEFHTHPDYKGTAFDVAVVRAPREFNLTKTVNIIDISDQPWNTGGYKECTITGFGSVSRVQTHEDDYTRKTHELKIESPCRCSNYLNYVLRRGTYLCSKAMEDYGLCAGDSGGGLVCDGKVMGVAMFIIGFTNAETCEIDVQSNFKCGSKKTISIFQDSYFVQDWLKSFLSPPSVDQHETANAPYSQTPTKPTNSHGCNIKLETVLLTLSMMINIF